MTRLFKAEEKEFAEFLESLKTNEMLMNKSERIVKVSKSLDLIDHGICNCVDMHYSLKDIVPGNKFDWYEEETIKLSFEFKVGYINVYCQFEYDEERFESLTQFIKEHDLELEKFGEENGYFNVTGMGFFEMDVAKEFTLILDECLRK